MVSPSFVFAFHCRVKILREQPHRHRTTDKSEDGMGKSGIMRMLEMFR